MFFLCKGAEEKYNAKGEPDNGVNIYFAQLKLRLFLRVHWTILNMLIENICKNLLQKKISDSNP